MRAKSEGRLLNALSIACGAIALAAGPVRAAEVTYERLVNPEPQNWLMNHHDFGAQRYSVLDTINKSNVKNLRLAFAVALGGTSGNENLTATPLVDDGFMYVPDAWGVVYKIDVRSGKSGDIVWKMDPGQEKIDRNRGVAVKFSLPEVPPSATAKARRRFLTFDLLMVSSAE